MTEQDWTHLLKLELIKQTWQNDFYSKFLNLSESHWPSQRDLSGHWDPHRLHPVSSVACWMLSSLLILLYCPSSVKKHFLASVLIGQQFSVHIKSGLDISVFSRLSRGQHSDRIWLSDKIFGCLQLLQQWKQKFSSVIY